MKIWFNSQFSILNSSTDSLPCERWHKPIHTIYLNDQYTQPLTKMFQTHSSFSFVVINLQIRIWNVTCSMFTFASSFLFSILVFHLIFGCFIHWVDLGKICVRCVSSTVSNNQFDIFFYLRIRFLLPSFRFIFWSIYNCFG